MKIEKLSEWGRNEALLGLSLNYKKDVSRMPSVLDKLAVKDGGHNKILEFMVVYWDITAPRYFWQEFDTYRVGVSKSSESTMHNLLDRDLTTEDLEPAILSQEMSVKVFNLYKTCLQNKPKAEQINELKKFLPESYLQRRIVCTNYKALRTILGQRKTHQLKEWKTFCEAVKEKVCCPQYLGEYL